MTALATEYEARPNTRHQRATEDIEAHLVVFRKWQRREHLGQRRCELGHAVDAAQSPELFGDAERDVPSRIHSSNRACRAPVAAAALLSLGLGRIDGWCPVMVKVTLRRGGGGEVPARVGSKTSWAGGRYSVCFLVVGSHMDKGWAGRQVSQRIDICCVTCVVCLLREI